MYPVILNLLIKGYNLLIYSTKPIYIHVSILFPDIIRHITSLGLSVTLTSK